MKNDDVEEPNKVLWGIYKNPKKRAIDCIGKQGKLMKKFKETEHFLKMLGRVNLPYILRWDCTNV